MSDDPILTQEQYDQLTTGFGTLLTATEVYKLGWKARHVEITALRSERDAALAKSDRLRDAYEGVRALNLQINDTSIGLLRERDAARAELAKEKGEHELTNDWVCILDETHETNTRLAGERYQYVRAQLAEAREALEKIALDRAANREPTSLALVAMAALSRLSSPGVQQRAGEDGDERPSGY